MFQFLGYNFFADGDSLNFVPSTVDNIRSTRLTNAIFDHMNVTRNTEEPFSTNIPVDWTYDTILNADFQNQLNAGNVDFLTEQISSVKIKRRVKGSFDWLTLKTIPISQPTDLNFVFQDFLNIQNTQYEYALVPVMVDVEGNYLINSVFSKFNGVFIGDAEQTFRLMYDVNYGNNTRNQQVGVFQPLGKKFPIVVANGLLSYENGSVTATILSDDFDKTGVVDRQATYQKQKELKDFLTNKKAKLLKDWNGGAWLCFITDSVESTYRSGSGMAVPQIRFNWAQIGDENSQQDLYNNGILKDLG